MPFFIDVIVSFFSYLHFLIRTLFRVPSESRLNQWFLNSYSLRSQINSCYLSLWPFIFRLTREIIHMSDLGHGTDMSEAGVEILAQL